MTKMEDYNTIAPSNWKKLLFPNNKQSLGQEDTAIFKLVAQWRRRFTLAVLMLCIVGGIISAIDNIVWMHHPTTGLFILSVPAVLGWVFYQILRRKTYSLPLQLTVAAMLLVSTTGASLINGILPLTLLAAVFFCYYLLLPTNLSLAFSLLTIGANVSGLMMSGLPYDENIFRRILIQAAIIVPALHFYVCLNNYLLTLYATVLSSRTRFFSGISHELRSPLHGLAGLIHLCKEDCISNPTIDKHQMLDHLAKMDRLKDHLAEIVSNTLDLGQLKAGKMVIKAEPVDLQAFLEEVSNYFEPSCFEKGLLLINDYPPELNGIVIESDSLRLRQILFNLISNAVKYTHAGRIRIETSLTEKTGSGTYLRLSIFDTGIGIPQTSLPFVFREYSQVHHEQKYLAKGTGLGLSLVKELVNALSGNCGAHSTEGVGSHFWVEIPVRQVGLSAHIERPERLPPQAHKNLDIFEEMRVLVAEDESINRQIVCKLLNKKGIHTIEAKNGREAVEIANDHTARIDLFLMDLQMPEMDGIEAIRQIRQINRFGKTPAICISGAIVDELEQLNLKKHFDEHVSKPINPEHLIAKVGFYRLMHSIQ